MTGINTDYKNTYWPVVIDMTELVRQPLYVVWLQATVVIDDIVVCGGDTATSHGLAHDKEIIPGITEQSRLPVRLTFLKAHGKMTRFLHRGGPWTKGPTSSRRRSLGVQKLTTAHSGPRACESCLGHYAVHVQHSSRAWGTTDNLIRGSAQPRRPPRLPPAHPGGRLRPRGGREEARPRHRPPRHVSAQILARRLFLLLPN